MSLTSNFPNILMIYLYQTVAELLLVENVHFPGKMAKFTIRERRQVLVSLF